jgi:hypothetical protein
MTSGPQKPDALTSVFFSFGIQPYGEVVASMEFVERSAPEE